MRHRRDAVAVRLRTQAELQPKPLYPDSCQESRVFETVNVSMAANALAEASARFSEDDALLSLSRAI